MDGNDDKGIKGNTGFEYTPKDMKRADMAPPGAVGRAPAAMPGPGLGTAGTEHQTTQTTQNQTADAQTEAEGKPLAVRTGDPDVDRHSEEQGHHLVDAAELVAQLQENMQAEGEATEATQTGVFVETNDPKVNAHYAQTQNMIATDADKEVDAHFAKEAEDAVFAKLINSEYNGLDNDESNSKEGTGDSGDEGI